MITGVVPPERLNTEHGQGLFVSCNELTVALRSTGVPEVSRVFRTFGLR
jgi:hypothetical protein